MIRDYFYNDIAEVTFAGTDKTFDVASVFFESSFLTVNWYGVIIAFGFLLAVLFGGRMAFKWKMDLNKMLDVLIYGAFAGIIGARLYYCIFNWSEYSSDPIRILYIWEGGLAIYGGIIGGVLAGFIVCKVEKLNFYNLLDLAGMSLLIGQGIGRWGNYANQEAFGGFAEGWGMRSEKIYSYIARYPSEFGLDSGISSAEVAQYMEEHNLFVHPTFFYESVWCIAGFLLLFLMCKKFRKFSGQIFLGYGIWYGAGRMFIEGMRTDSLYIGNSGLRVSQLLSAVIVIVCTVVMIAMIIKYSKNPKPVEGVDYYIEPVPFLKKNREKFEAKKAEEENSEELNNDVHKD